MFTFFRYLLIFLFGCSGILFAQTKKEVYSKNIPYSDEDVGVIFPAQISSFSKTEVRKKNNPMYGTVIRYAGNLGGCSADIYLYSLKMEPALISAKEFEEHAYEVAAKNIMRLPTLSPTLEAVEELAHFDLFVNDKKTGLRKTFHFTISGGDYISEMVLFPCYARIIKLRLSYPEGLVSAGKDAEEFIKHITSLFFQKKKVDFRKSAGSALPIEEKKSK